MKEFSQSCVVLLFALFLFAFHFLPGCDSPSPDVDYKAGISAVAAVASVQAPQIAPEPDLPEGVCPDCKGAGVIGDGTVMVNCLTCGGDGRTDDASEPLVLLPEDPVEAPPEALTEQVEQPQQYSQDNCPGGVCPPQRRAFPRLRRLFR